MDHLKAEDIARLVDEAPTSGEARHLGDCEQCGRELRGLIAQTRLLAELPDLLPPPALRSRIEDALASEEAAGPVRRARTFPVGVARIAAAVALFLTGGLAGTFLVAPAIDAPAALVTTAGTPSVGDAAVEDAAASLRSAEAQYLGAVIRYAELTQDDSAVDPVNRLVALEGIVVTTQAALREAPADPIINNFHLTALGQRDALLRQIDLAMSDDEWF